MAYTRIPSKKSLMDVFHISAENANKIRDLLYREDYCNDEYSRLPLKEYNEYGSYQEWSKEKVSEILGFFGEEYIRSNSSKEGFSYLNTGDTYGTTILFRGNNAWIGNWGTIVERGGYE